MSRKESDRKYYESHKEEILKRNTAKQKSMKRFLDAVKSYPCMDCGKFFPPCAMQFDHRDPSDKLKEIINVRKDGSWSKLITEIMKCDLVCANCHAIRTHGC